jgi:hypothetical protein
VFLLLWGIRADAKRYAHSERGYSPWPLCGFFAAQKTLQADLAVDPLNKGMLPNA